MNDQGKTIQVFGELELADRIRRGEPHCRCLISIGNPRAFLAPIPPGTHLPRLFRDSFDRVLRLEFFDVDSVDQLGRMRPHKVAELRDIEAVLRFHAETASWTDGWTVHCWQGLSRSPAVALGLLYLTSGDTELAGRELKRIRPEGRPLQRIVGLYDQVLGTDLRKVSDRIRAERIEEMKRELNLDADMLLEELPEA